MDHKSNFRPEDEVCIICNGELVFGTVERKKTSDVSNPSSNEWSVTWNGRPDSKVKTVVKEDQLTLTDRPLYKGCRVQRADKPDGQIGICRSVNLFADLRVVGTTTVLEQTNIIRFRHLKEYKQKSVVYQNGWLGIITEVTRSARVRLSNGNFSKVPLARVQPVSPFIVEPPWINECVANASRVISQSYFEGVQPIWPATNIEEQNALFVEDLEVDSVKVAWRYQVDLMSPDPPNSTILPARLSKLKVVKEECDSESTFQMGNLGRYFLRSADELKSVEEYERRFVRANMPSRFPDLTRNRSPPLRAYEKDPEKRIVPESSIVVEIVHLSGTGDIMWQDKTMEFVKSTDLVVLKESLLSTEIMAGTFVFSKRFIDRTPEEAYGVVQMTDISNKTVTLLLLSCDDPPNIIEQKMTLKESEVYAHPRYKYFNESNTIVVAQHNDGSVRIGNVLDTNLSGKVFVHWIDTDRDEWYWPSQCSVFSVKGFDLECIISLINDADEVKDCPSKKLHKVLEKLKEICNIWNDADADNIDERQESLGSLKYVISACQTAESAHGSPGQYFSSIKRHSNLLKESDIKCADPSIKANVKSMCQDLVREAEILYSVLLELDQVKGNSLDLKEGNMPPPLSNEAVPVVAQVLPSSSQVVPMEVDNNQNSLSPESRETLMTQFDDARKSGIFIERVLVDSAHPSTHQYASKTEFMPDHQRCFLATVKRELENLRSSYAPGLKIRTYCDRYDLYSIAICGPERTPYENSLYLFDAVLPPNYPSVPPQFHFLSYGAGRLNPNLYAEGKVCVSLLGTWAGKNPQEKWTKESNLFQVLLSIQALILVNEPYHNEPGLEENNCPAGSVSTRRHGYNSHLMPKIATMMISQMQRPGAPWAEDIKTFYLEHVPKFITRWTKWLDAAASSYDEAGFLSKLAEDERPGFVIYPFSATFTSQMKQSVSKLEEALKKLNEQTNLEELGAGEPNVSLPGDHAVPSLHDIGEAAVSSTVEAIDFD